MNYKFYKDYIDLNLNKLILLEEFKKEYNLINSTDDLRCLRFLKSNNLLNYENFLYDPIKKHIIHTHNYKEYVLAYFIINLQNFGKIDYVIGHNEISQTLKRNTEDSDINHISLIFNIFNIDIKKDIYVFDDGINYLILDNSIYIKQTYRMNAFEDLKLYYIFANNQYGKDRYNNNIKIGHKVFNWENFLKDLNIKNKIYDIHSLSKIMNVNELNLKKYFI